MPSMDEAGNAARLAPEHIGAIAGANVGGTVLLLTVIVMVAVLAHWPASGVKV